MEATVVVNVRESLPPELDHLVALAEGLKNIVVCSKGEVLYYRNQHGTQIFEPYRPCTDQAVGGALIDRESITTFRAHDDQDGKQVWGADPQNIGNWNLDGKEIAADWVDTGIYDCQATGPTRLIAAMRCHVISYLGTEVTVTCNK